MTKFATAADSRAIEAEQPWAERDMPKTLFQMLGRVADKHGARNAATFQMFSDPDAPAETLSWDELRGQTIRAANLFRSLGIGADDVVAYVLPNSTETQLVFLGGAIAGIVTPINPLLDADQIAAILREVNARVVVTLRAFPRTDIASKVARALEDAPNVTTVLEVDLKRYVTPPKSWLIPLIRPRHKVNHSAQILDFNAELNRQSDQLEFPDSAGDRIAAYFHTGGTTGMPKVVQHSYSGMIYNGWVGRRLLFTENDTVMCPLPMFHVFACQAIMMSMLASGSHVVFPTPAGFRGDGVFDNFWKLLERWQITFVITVPTALSALMQRPVDADVSSVQMAFSGSAPLPVKLYERFHKATGVNIVEGYGLTETTCLVSCNPIDGPKKIGSVGLPFPHTDVRILEFDAEGKMIAECETGEVGEICISSPGVLPGQTYKDAARNIGLFSESHVRTGDLGYMDEDGFLWITGRAKDLIIRGGHNIDPAEIEEVLTGHEAVAFAGAVGQPDAFSGELPCAYVELVKGADATVDELTKYASDRVKQRGARPKWVEILPELPKTAVGKVFKPELRKLAIKRVFDQALAAANISAEVREVTEEKRLGLVAIVQKTGEVEPQSVREVLDEFAVHWRWTDG